jgi:hypothetical protein
MAISEAGIESGFAVGCSPVPQEHIIKEIIPAMKMLFVLIRSEIKNPQDIL